MSTSLGLSDNQSSLLSDLQASETRFQREGEEEERKKKERKGKKTENGGLSWRNDT